MKNMAAPHRDHDAVSREQARSLIGPPPISDDKRDEMYARLAAGLALIHGCFEPHRQRMAILMQPVQQRRVAQRISRNDRCPCGKRKKYKQSCGDASTLH